MKVLTITNEKGGVGKTLCSFNIAAAAAILGWRVLLVDADAQGNSTLLSKIPRTSSGLVNTLLRDYGWNEVLFAPDSLAWAGAAEPSGNLWILPSSVDTRILGSRESDDSMHLRSRLHELSDHLDLVVIDTSPTPSLLHNYVYMATDYALLPTRMSLLSLDGLNNSLTHIKNNAEARALVGLPPIEVIGIQPTIFNTKRVGQQRRKDQTVERFGDLVWRPLRDLGTWEGAEDSKQSLFSYAPKQAATAEAWEMVEHVMDVIGGNRAER